MRAQEKETELANITAERSRLVNEELEQMQEREKKLNEDNNKLKGQLKQLTKDFQYNLQLLKDRDTELELLENQISAHKETSAVRAKVSMPKGFTPKALCQQSNIAVVTVEPTNFTLFVGTCRCNSEAR